MRRPDAQAEQQTPPLSVREEAEEGRKEKSVRRRTTALYENYFINKRDSDECVGGRINSDVVERKRENTDDSLPLRCFLLVKDRSSDKV